MAESGPPEEPQEPVHAPHRDDAPPRRTLSPVIWLTVAIIAILALGIALVIAAIGAA